MRNCENILAKGNVELVAGSPAAMQSEKTRQKIRALENVNISVEHGEFLAQVGPSGCGKSTILRIASGLDYPSSGTINTSTKKVGYVFQDSTLMPWRTVRKNVELLAELEKIDKESI